MCIEQIRLIIVDRYNKIFDAWYRDYPQKPRATIVFEITDSNLTGYDRSIDTIYIRLPEGNLNEFQEGNYSRLPKLWECEILHEMIHEYQFKVLRVPSAAGIELFNQYQITDRIPRVGNGFMGFPGNGHDELFYTAIDIFYKNCHNSVEEFIKHYI